RRHTRFSRDWSSDVCSSDLAHVQNLKTLLLVFLEDKMHQFLRFISRNQHRRIDIKIPAVERSLFQHILNGHPCFQLLNGCFEIRIYSDTSILKDILTLYAQKTLK